MRPQLHSPPLWSRRPIAAGLSLIAGALIAAGCGSDEGGDVTFTPQARDDFVNALDTAQAYLDDGDCERAIERIEGLQSAVETYPDISEQARSDLDELLTELGGQIEEDCVDETTTSTTTTTEDEETTSSDTTEEHTTESSTSTEEDTTSSSTTTEETTTEPPPEEEVPPPGQGGTPPGQGGVPPGQEGESGGVGPGFESDGRVLP
jgi:hypothetical protein